MNKFKTILSFPVDLYFSMIQALPGSIGNKLRYYYWKSRLGHLGHGSIISEGVRIDHPKNVFIGDDCHIDRYSILIAGVPRSSRKTADLENQHYNHSPGEIHIGRTVHVAPFTLINGIGGISIGNYSGIASGAKLYSYSHHYRNTTKSDGIQYLFANRAKKENQFMLRGPIVVEDFCAVGLNAIVFPGVHIGKGSWVGAGAVVSKDIGERKIYTNLEEKSIDGLSLPY